MRFLLLFAALLASSAQAAIEHSTDGGQTWTPLSTTQFLGFERIAASGAECADSVIADTADGSNLQ